MMREIANPSMLHDGSGMGAMVGVMATLMAEDGFEGAPAITLEEAAEHWADLGARWTIEENYIKPYPICRWAHAALGALEMLLSEHAIDGADIARIEVQTFAEAAALFPGMPQTTSQAQYSLAFALASVVIHGEIGPEHVQGAALSDPRVAEVVERISIHENARHSERFPAARWSDVRVHLRDGQVHASGDVHAKGGPEAPMSEAEFAAKLQGMTRGLGAERQAAFLALRGGLLAPDARFADCLRVLFDPVGGCDA
jgi:2-methylcitrate dehydratase PrpD